MPWHSAPATFVTLPAGILRVLDGFWVAVQEKFGQLLGGCARKAKGAEGALLHCSVLLSFPFLSPDNKLSDGLISSL